MMFGVEKKKLEKLQSGLLELTDFNDHNHTELQEIHKFYVQIIKKLHSKEANIFANIHKYGIAEMKKHKEQLRMDGNQENFDAFKNFMAGNMEDALGYLTEYLHV